MKSLQGHLLIAAPTLLDPNFFRSVVLIVQHTEDGALGLIINRPLTTTVREAWRQVAKEPCKVDGVLYQGGPCEGPLMVVHTNRRVSDIEILPGLHFSTDRDSIEHLVRRNASRMKFFVGYSGWAAGQLEGELAADSWLVAPATPELVFSESDDQWTTIIRQISPELLMPGVNPKTIPPDPSFN